MNVTQRNSTRRAVRSFAVRSLAAAAVVAALVPLNMGGCATDATSITSGVASKIGIGGGGNSSPAAGGTGNASVDKGVAFVRGGQQVMSAGDDSVDKERALGQSVAANLTSRNGTVADDALNRYVTMVAQTVANATPAGGQVFVTVLNGNDVNAYSGPTGYVLITRGALRQMQDESELAGVLAHEIAHVIERHGMASVNQSNFVGGLLTIGQAAAGSKNAQIANLVSPLVDKIITSAHSQAQESEADADAVRYVAAAGYDAAGFQRFLQRLAQTQGNGSQLFSTHPGLGSRVQAVTAQLQREGLSGGQANRERFEAMVLKRL